jgi:hypothetical protein
MTLDLDRDSGSADHVKVFVAIAGMTLIWLMVVAKLCCRGA